MQEVTIAEAAQRLGMSTDTIRRRISTGQLKARKISSPHGEMYIVALPDDTPAGSQRGNETAVEIESLRKMLSILETELEARRREVQELHILLQRAQTALPQPMRHIPWWQRLLLRAKNKGDGN